MAIITYLGRNVNEYREKSEKILRAKEIYCPKHPDEKMAMHDNYQRGIKESGEKIQIMRLICNKCGGTQAILPDFLLPYKQYSADEIEAVIMDAETNDVYEIETKASVYTIRRWIKELSEKMKSWISVMKAILIEMHGYTPSEISMAGMTPIEQIRELKQQLPKIKASGNLLGYASMYAVKLGIPNST
jgi:ribosomal protein S27AE